MSRVGKKALAIPQGVDVSINGREIAIKGPKGSQTMAVPANIVPTLENNELSFALGQVAGRQAKLLNPVWGTTRALARNMIDGVTKGFSITLGLVGVGYRANVAGSKLNMTLGYSHPVEIDVPQGITVEAKDQTTIVISGIDKQRVGEFAAFVRAKRPPEPFKGKGVRYSNETINLKEGKKK